MAAIELFIQSLKERFYKKATQPTFNKQLSYEEVIIRYEELSHR